MIQQWAKDAWAKVVEDQRRADFLDSRYLADGRDSKDHPLHSLYTGLYIQWVADEPDASARALPDGDVLGDLSPSSVPV